jgi:hypothetical protein
MGRFFGFTVKSYLILPVDFQDDGAIATGEAEFA